MDLRPHISKDNLSHAYIIEGERAEGLRALRELVESFGVAIQANPDHHEYVFETLTIDDAHELRREQGLHGVEGAKKIFIVAFNSITIESQNALLKTLEEPKAETHFFFLVRTSAMLLPTVRSRMQLIRSSERGGDTLSYDFAKKFLDSTVSERMKMIERMTKAKKDDKQTVKEDARVFVDALEELLYERFGDKSLKTHAHILQDVLTTKHELSGRSPSVKLLLEYLALTIPKALD